MGHTPSVPVVQQPEAAKSPRFSTSGILNAQIKEKNRQGLLSTFGGRTGNVMNINKFAEEKIKMRDPKNIPLSERLARLYAEESAKAKAKAEADAKAKAEAAANAKEKNPIEKKYEEGMIDKRSPFYNAVHEDLVKQTNETNEKIKKNKLSQ